MRLGVDIRCLQDPVRTGVGEYVWQVLRVLSQDKNISLSGFANAAGRIDLPIGLEKMMSIKRCRLPNKIMNLKLWLKLGLTIDEILNSQGEKIDVLWLPNPSFAFVSAKTPTLLTVHDLSFIYYPQFFRVKGRLWYFPAVRSLLAKGLPQKSLVAAVSKHTAEDLASQWPQLEPKIRLVPPGLNENFFLLPSAQALTNLQQRYHLPPKFILSLGTIEPRKNYALLIKMYDLILKLEPDFPYDLVIAGSWGWRFQPLKRFLASLPSQARIHFIGYVPEADKATLYALAQIFLYPSLYEGIGLPPLEAMAAGTPVIVSNVASLPEVVANGGILLSPYSVEVWSQTVSWLGRDQVAREELGQKGLKQASKFSWQNTAEAYKGLFKELIAKDHDHSY